MNILRRYFAFRRQRKLIEAALRELYSENFDFSFVLGRLARSGGKQGEIQSIVAIETAGKLDFPLSKNDVLYALKILSIVERAEDHELKQKMVEIRKKIAEMYWLQASYKILELQKSYIRNKESYEGTIYILSKQIKSPVSQDVQDELKERCERLNELCDKMERLKAAESGAEALSNYASERIQMLEREIREAEVHFEKNSQIFGEISVLEETFDSIVKSMSR